ncbi:uncharacterized protein B0H18DRAFT_70607 [Fomitopsis serialis]|uniref:uncharacterized protein n=1 Tax=Fomitopsis serialis TaxID=139415 RepID=UPI00200774CD|nr:uncharacterized protein B0H18DRAFT_70607 [Neoantrodia serialis]KAH9931929.1 hypothetical protein B0H18DRAFT_70607 [Neoantrodia serialis]
MHQKLAATLSSTSIHGSRAAPSNTSHGSREKIVGGWPSGLHEGTGEYVPDQCNDMRPPPIAVQLIYHVPTAKQLNPVVHGATSSTIIVPDAVNEAARCIQTPGASDCYRQDLRLVQRTYHVPGDVSGARQAQRLGWFPLRRRHVCLEWLTFGLPIIHRTRCCAPVRNQGQRCRPQWSTSATIFGISSPYPTAYTYTAGDC